MTGERDLPSAIKKATQADLIPRPLDELIFKLYAYRGNEPGVSHGHVGTRVRDVESTPRACGAAPAQPRVLAPTRGAVGATITER